MEDNYFDNKLKDILENPPEFKPDARAISDMERRLDAPINNKPSRAAWLWWLLPLFFLPFLFGTIFFYTKYQTLNTKLNDLNSQLIHYQKDTTSQNYITYHYDTIYNTIYKDIIVERHYERQVVPPPIRYATFGNYSNPSNLLGSRNLTDFGVYSAGNVFGQPPNVFSAPFINSGQFLEKGLSRQELLEKEFDLKNRIAERIKDLDLEEVETYKRFRHIHLQEMINDPNWEPFERNVNPIRYFVPKGINVSFAHSPTNNGNFSDANYSGKSVGLYAALEFHKNIQLQIGAENLGLEFEIKDQSLYTKYPIVNPDDPTDFLKELKVNTKYLQIPIIFQKSFRMNKVLQPIFGVGIVATKPYKQNIKYEYISSNVGEYDKNQTLKAGDFSVNNIRTTIGLNYNFWRKWSLHSEFMYQHAFEQGAGEYHKLNYFGWRTGLKYSFM